METQTKREVEIELWPMRVSHPRYRKWADRLSHAKKRGHFTARELEYAGSWMTCAVGEKYGYKGTAMDEALFPSTNSAEDVLGMSFLDAVRRDDVDAAQRIYDEIMALPVTPREW